MKYPLFERFGAELEYMLVRQDTLDIAPIADLLLFDAGADLDGDLDRGAFGWSNELANHVVELKTSRPVSSLAEQQEGLQKEITWFLGHAARHGCALLPTAMHPWMNPVEETVLWPHGNADIYQTYHRIFDCRSHGWTNVQSAHLNISFASDEEFEKLHAAIRLLLPLIPAIAASSPIVEGRQSGKMDSRLFHYRDNQALVPEIAGLVVPEAVYTEDEYRRAIFDPIAAAMAKHDPEGMLELDFLNSRGAIARFDRGSIEIRLVDVQECPAADIAILQLLVATLQWIIETVDLEKIRSVCTEDLASVLWRCAEDGGQAMIEMDAMLDLCGFESPVIASDLWRAIFTKVGGRMPLQTRKTAAAILLSGNLSSRVLKATAEAPSRENLRSVYQRLADCLAQNTLFQP